MFGPWSAFRSSSYGYGHLEVHNRTHLHWRQLLDEGRGGNDHLWIIREGSENGGEEEKEEEESDD
jgi:hypothetical protein